jgi:hypothetical protein
VLGDGRRPLRADTPHPVPFPPYAANRLSWRTGRCAGWARLTPCRRGGADCQSTRCSGRDGFLVAVCSASSRKDSALATASRAGRVLKTQLR